MARDVSHRKSLEVSLSRSKRQAQFTLESIGEGIITTDNDGHIDYMNRAAETLIGTSRDDAAGHKIGELFTLVDDSDRRPLGDPVDRCLAMRRRVNMGRRAVMVTQDGEQEHSVELSASPIRGPSDSISGTVVVFHDVGELRGLTRKMSYQATHDPLTGLVNRREFERRLDDVVPVRLARRDEHRVVRADFVLPSGDADSVSRTTCPLHRRAATGTAFFQASVTDPHRLHVEELSQAEDAQLSSVARTLDPAERQAGIGLHEGIHETRSRVECVARDRKSSARAVW